MININLYINLLEILGLKDIQHMSLMNDYYYNVYEDNINYIGLLKLKSLGFKKFTNNNFSIYNKIKSNRNFKKITCNIYDYIFKYSARQGHLDVLQLLIENGVDLHITDEYALSVSAQNGYLEIVRYLIEVGANVGANDNEALKYSVRRGYLVIAKILMENGANIHAEDDIALKYNDI